MSKTIAQLEKENKELTVKLNETAACARKETAERISLSIENRELKDAVSSKEELLEAMSKKYLFASPEKLIVQVLEEQELPEQVRLLTQISGKKLIQWRNTKAKHEHQAKFHSNVIADLERGMEKSLNGEFVLPAA